MPSKFVDTDVKNIHYSHQSLLMFCNIAIYIFHSLTYYLVDWSQIKRCGTDRFDQETSFDTGCIRGDNQNISPFGLENNVNEKLSSTVAIIIRCNQIPSRIEWIKVIIVKITVGVHWTATYENVRAIHRSCYLNRLIIIIARVSRRSRKC
jgi:hypothetical protein